MIGPTTRRSFLGGATASVAALALLRDPFALAGTRVPAARGGRFAQGVASGQPTTNGITLWSRVDELGGESRVQFEISPDRDFRRVIHRQETVVSPENGFTALQRVDDPRTLAPGEEYFYRCLTCDESSSVGRFRTARPADSAEPVRIGFFSCQDFEAGYYTAHAGLAAEDLDLVVCLGDYIYERSFYEGPEDRRDPIGESETLEQYRGKYALYHSDQKLRRVREQFPIMAIWDDHEVEDNYAAEEPGGATQSRDIPFLERRANAYRAFFEHMPRIRVPGAPTRIYGSVPLGGSAEVLLLDERQYRSDQPCNPDDEGFRDQQACPTNEPLYDPENTLLGAEQTTWLRERLAASTATWKVVGNQVMAMAVDAPAGYPLNDDQWDGYGANRGELLEFVRAQGIENLTFITGDIHTFFAGRVAPSGRTVDPDGPSPVLGDDGRYSEVPVATEFVGGSITSRGFGDAFPVEAEFELEEQSTATAFEGTILANNPHMNYMDGKRRGYGVLIASPQELRVLFRTPRSTETEESTVETTAEFVVAEGTTDVDIVRFTSGTGREP